MRALQFITDHVIFKLGYNQIYQMKTPIFLSRRKHVLIPITSNEETKTKYIFRTQEAKLFIFIYGQYGRAGLTVDY